LSIDLLAEARRRVDGGDPRVVEAAAEVLGAGPAVEY
jgi:hypothetical protein